VYEDLVKQLRYCYCAVTCEGCPYGFGGCEEDLMKNAAKAIEEQNRRIDRAVDMYNRNIEKTAMYEALIGLSPEPPQEENMSLFIKGMKMPKNCRDCIYIQRDRPAGKVYCTATDPWLNISLVPINSRHAYCPLVEVPQPHGRLIDASEEIMVQTYDEEHEEWCQHKMTINDLLLRQGWIDAKAPTVIPAEEAQ